MLLEVVLLSFPSLSFPSLLSHKFHISYGNWNKDEMTRLYLGQIKSDFHKIFQLYEVKMYQITNRACPSRQLFIKITFAFTKIFDFVVKIALNLSFSLFSSRFASRVTAQNQRSIAAVTCDANLSIEREMLQKWIFWLENQKFS